MQSNTLNRSTDKSTESINLQTLYRKQKSLSHPSHCSQLEDMYSKSYVAGQGATSLNSTLAEYKKFEKDSSEEYTRFSQTDFESSVITNTRTMDVLTYCNRHITIMLNGLMISVGWRPLSSVTQYSEKNERRFNILNHFIQIILVALVLFSYIYQIISCRFSLSKNDELSDIFKNSTPMPWMTLVPSTNHSNHSEYVETCIKCSHVFTSYAVPNLLHLLAYGIGVFYYRIRGNEDIFGLMEKTVQYSSSVCPNRTNHIEIRRKLLTWWGFAVVWSGLNLLNMVLYYVSRHKNPDKLIFEICLCTFKDTKYTYLLIVLDIIGYIIYSFVTSIIILHYAIYCELVKIYSESICRNTGTKFAKISVIKININNVSIATDLINGFVGTMTNLIMLVFSFLFIISLNRLFYSPYEQYSDVFVAFRIYFVLIIIPLLLVPIIQCARANSSLAQIKSWAMEMAVFGVRKDKSKDIDSFLLYISNYKNKIKLLYLPIEWDHVLLALTVIGMGSLIIIQQGMLDEIGLNKTNFFKFL